MPHETRLPSPIAREIFNAVENNIREVLQQCDVTVYHIMALSLWQRGFPETAKDTIIISTHDTNATGWIGVAQLVFEIVEERAR